MSRPAFEVLRDIASFVPVGGAWRPLDDLLDELWASGTPPKGALAILFGVFERFPTEDGAGVFWSIVHGVEALPYGYADELEASHRRIPSEMAGIMLARFARSGGAG
jgi:hypothetical protein